MPICHECKALLREGDRFCSGCGAHVVGDQVNGDTLVGQTIGDAYVILEPIGSGGMGRVYRAEQKMLGRTVAIKFIHPHLLGDEQTVARFYVEARTASRLNHPNSVSIFDFGRTQDDALYLVMEYLQGRDLADVLASDGPLPFARICHILTSMLTALGEAHALGVIHRDLKPENVFIERTRMGTDLVKVVDFGLAKILAADPQEASLTSPGLVCGTSAYMSPEQGRGETLDGRSDIYAAGVMLFEMLTGRVPFVDETPAKVVLKHIQDPVPDPRKIAPHRGIPLGLVEVSLRAMAKSAAHRFQNAEEMIAALQAASGVLRSDAASELSCAACGAVSLAGRTYCGKCGAPLKTVELPSVPRFSRAPVLSSPPRLRSPLVGVTEELERVDKLREQTRGCLVWINLVGEPGVGKTRLLAEIADRATEAGDLVFAAGPHDSGAPVPYWPMYALLASLCQGDQAALSNLAGKGTTPLEVLARAGVSELLNPVGLIGADGAPRAGAVASALAMGIRLSMAQAGADRVVLVVDDLDRCDGLTPQALRHLQQFTQGGSVLLLTATVRPAPELLADGAVAIPLPGVSVGEAHLLLSGMGQAQMEPSLFDRRMLLPLYLEQVRRLGLSLHERDKLPPRLADAVAQRLERLDVADRRVLQAAAVLGYRCSRSALMEIAGAEQMSALGSLSKAGFVSIYRDVVEIIHPFIRDLVEAFIPAEVRKQLHARVLTMMANRDLPLEVRAIHTYRAGEVFAALTMLERMGNRAASRGDVNTSVLAYRRGLELARHEAVEMGDTSLDTAVGTFSLKLGAQLARQGDLTGAEGVLRENVDLTEPRSAHRMRMLIALASAVAGRKRFRDADRLLRQAFEIASELKNDSWQAEVRQGMATVRRAAGDFRGASDALAAANELLGKCGAEPMVRAAAVLQLASSLMEGGELDGTQKALAEAESLALQADAPYLSAQVHSMFARLEDLRGNANRALERYEDAIKLASFAGDAESVCAWEAVVHQMTKGSASSKTSTMVWER